MTLEQNIAEAELEMAIEAMYHAARNARRERNIGGVHAAATRRALTEAIEASDRLRSAHAAIKGSGLR